MANEPKTYYLEELFVGQRFMSGPYTMNADEIKAFGEKFDPQPFHTDEEAATDSFFKGLAASGWHIAAVMMRLLIQGGMPFAGGSVGLGGHISWLKPVRPGDTLSLENEITAIAPSKTRPGMGIVTMMTTVKNQHGEAVQTFEGKVMAFCRTYSGG